MRSTTAWGEGVSYELCQALAKVVNADSVDAFDISFNWSRVAAPPSGAPQRLEFNHVAMETTDKVAIQLKTRTCTRRNLIYGVVTDLSHQPDDEDGRVGVRTLLQRCSRIVWMHLPPDIYHVAVRCRDEGVPVRVQGVLTSPPGGQATMEVADFGPDPSLPLG